MSGRGEIEDSARDEQEERPDLEALEDARLEKGPLTLGEVAPRWSAVNSADGYGAAAVLIAVDHPDRFEAHDLIHVRRTGEVMSVRGKWHGHLRVLRRAQWGAAPLRDNDEIVLIGSAA